MKTVDTQHRRVSGNGLLILTLLLAASVCISPPPAKAQEATTTTIRAIDPLTGSNSFIFNATEYPVNSTFTVDFYVENATAMAGWQIYTSWNNTIINFKNGGVPDNNALAPGVIKGQTSLIVPSILFGLEIIGDTGFLKYGARLAVLKQGVKITGIDVPGQALLCEINFTVAASPEDSQISTNIDLIKQSGETGSSMDTYVLTKPSPDLPATTEPVLTQPALIRIVKSEFQIIKDVAVASITASPFNMEQGDMTTISVILINLGNDIEDFNLTIAIDQVPLVTIPQVLGPFQNSTSEYPWNSSDVQLNTPIKVTILGIPIVSVNQGYPVISANVTLPGDINETNNQAEVTLTVKSKLVGLSYFVWLLTLWLSTTLGQVLIVYAILFFGFLAATTLLKRFRPPKSPAGLTGQTAVKPDTATSE